MKDKLKILPEKPGVYLMKDGEGKVIYVGKAVSLRKRVLSYFRDSAVLLPKTAALAARIRDLDWIVTDNETEALILEDRLIKKYSPRYNIMLRDSKTYPFIKITGEEFPRVVVTRRVEKDGADYFGPYVSSGLLRENLELLKKVFCYRSCGSGRFRRGEPCLNYHIGICPAPCAGKITAGEYGKGIDKIRKFLKGDTGETVRFLEKEMQKASNVFDYEKAARYRDSLRAVSMLSDRQKIVADSSSDADYIVAVSGAGKNIVQIFHVRRGKLLGKEFFRISAAGGEETADILNPFLRQYYREGSYIPEEIVLEMLPGDHELLTEHLAELRGKKVRLKVPVRGRKAELLKMVRLNAGEELQKIIMKSLTGRRKGSEAAAELASYLGIDGVIQRMECVDISNIQGTDSVASLVVFRNGMPEKRQYRRYRIKTVEGADDFASIHEVIKRRFARGRRETENGEKGIFDGFPDLLIIDGGKGQLSMAVRALRETGFENVNVVGLAKREEELFLPGKSFPVILPRDSEALYLVQRIRDEAHRFAVSYHRSLRGKRNLASVLDGVPGIGPAKRQALLKEFGSLRKIMDAQPEELAKVPGISDNLAANIYNYLKTHQDLQDRLRRS